MTSNASGPPRYGVVVVGTDGSAAAGSALLWAAAEAARRESPLRIVHGADTENRAAHTSVETLDRIGKAGQELLEKAAAEVTRHYPGVEVTTEFSRSKPAASLRSAAGTDGTIVVGSRGVGGFSALLLGSVGLQVAADGEVPVVVVRDDGQRAGAGVVLVAVRGAADLDCVRHAARAAELRKASLRMLSVWNVLQYVGLVAPLMDDVDEIAHRRFSEISTVADRIREEFPGLTVTTDVEKGNSTAGVLVEASRDADLLVMAGGRGHRLIGPSLARVTHAVLHHAHCPVLLVPCAGGAAEPEQEKS
ncbi:universal stress protein [Streptomyces sp. NPDC057460]|uniref:universal stress protein n=1 Tax=Streptomyces sp. NPDC057460 TaxID=3346141 RepID=UPI00368EE5B6